MDEPTAGMAPRERVALMALTARHRARARPRRAVHRARHGRGVRPRRPHHGHEPRPAGRRWARRTRCAPTRWCRRSISAPAPAAGAAAAPRAGPDARCSRSPPSHAYYGRAHILDDVAFERRLGRGGGAARPQRRRQVDDAEGIMGLVPPRQGLDQLRRAQHRRAAALSDRPPRPRLRAGGAPRLPRAHGRREPRGRPPAAAPPARRTGRPSGCSSCFPNLAELRVGQAGRISGGEQQMLTIARTLMGNPARDPARRALRGPGTGDRRADGADHRARSSARA